MVNEHLNCVVIGYHDMDFNGFAARQKSMQRTSGAYHEVTTNSLLCARISKPHAMN
jgi:hypothetical protein